MGAHPLTAPLALYGRYAPDFIMYDALGNELGPVGGKGKGKGAGVRSCPECIENGICEDGLNAGVHAAWNYVAGRVNNSLTGYRRCAYGTDCHDCGWRPPLPQF